MPRGVFVARARSDDLKHPPAGRFPLLPAPRAKDESPRRRDRDVLRFDVSDRSPSCGDEHEVVRLSIIEALERVRQHEVLRRHRPAR